MDQNFFIFITYPTCKFFMKAIVYDIIVVGTGYSGLAVMK